MSADALKKENAELISKIAALKLKLGIAQAQDEAERKRVKQIFDMFDKDNSGYIDRGEFEVLAFESGGEISALTEAHIETSFQAANTSGDGRITFDQFLDWLRSDKEYVADQDSDVLAMTRLRLQSHAWVRRYKRVKESVADHKSAAPAPAPKPAGSDGSAKKFNMFFGLGQFQEAKSSIALEIFRDAAGVAAVKEQVDCPAEVVAFAHVDFALRADADDMKIGELVGMVEVLLDSVPWNQLPMNLIHSHKVDMYEADDGKKFLRVVIFSSGDPFTMLQNITGRPLPPDQPFGKCSMRFELPFSLPEFAQDRQKTLEPTDLGFRFRFDSDFEPSVANMASEVVQRLPPSLLYETQLRIAFYKFTGMLDFTVKLGKVQELLDYIPDDHPSLGKLKTSVDSFCGVAVGQAIADAFEGLKGPAQAQRELYNAVRETVTGLSRIQVSLHSAVIRLDVNGLDFVSFLPALD